MRTHLFPFAWGLITLGVLIVSVAQADVVILKDGFTLHGKLVKEKTVIEGIVVDKGNGLTLIDDGPRAIIFPANYKEVGDAGAVDKFKDLVSYSNTFQAPPIGNRLFPASAVDPTFGEWNIKLWSREAKYKDALDPTSRHTVIQNIVRITPYSVAIGSTTHRVSMWYLTKEFSPETLRGLLAQHPDIKEETGKPDGEKRERLIRFWLQAEWLEEAEKDFQKFQKDLPQDRERIARLQSELLQLKAERLLTEMEKAKDGGRYQWLKQALHEFPEGDLPKKIKDRVNTLKNEYETVEKKFARAQHWLEDLPYRLGKSIGRAWWIPPGLTAGRQSYLCAAALTISSELHLDTVSRLDTFVTLAEQYDRDLKQGRKPLQTVAQLLAAAVTGWHMGKNSAETDEDSARRVWETRLMVQEYLTTKTAPERYKIYEEYSRKSEALPYDVLEKLISLLVPPDRVPEDDLLTEPTEKNTGELPLFPKGINYTIQLPPEYQAGRSYPLLILLGDAGEKPSAFLKRFKGLPAQAGYIVAVPDWSGLSSRYNYSDEEREMVPKLLWHLRRKYQVDSDRVFLMGHAEGANLALDVAAGHPDIFAGVVSGNPTPLPILLLGCEYWANFHKLPAYIYLGERSNINTIKHLRAVMEKWMMRGYPILCTSMKGRPPEWFPEEVPFILEWMSQKRRKEAGRVLGPTGVNLSGAEGYRTVRPSDNRFYWLSVGHLVPTSTIDANFGTADKPKGPGTPAKIQGKITEGNLITVNPIGMKQVTIWFGKGMLDYDKPVKMKIGSQPLVTKTINPNTQILLEDLYERADRQRPYFEKVEFKIP